MLDKHTTEIAVILLALWLQTT